jgi:hypothetical protein
MHTSRIYVDFNEMPSNDEVLLSQGDTTADALGNLVVLIEGMRLAVYSDDQDENGEPDNLIAEGVALRNHHGGWTNTARWLLKVNERGIRHESDEASAAPPGA